jgi:hypothetical protein
MKSWQQKPLIEREFSLRPYVRVAMAKQEVQQFQFRAKDA